MTTPSPPQPHHLPRHPCRARRLHRLLRHPEPTRIWTSHTPAPSSAPTASKYWRKDHQFNSLSPTAFTNSGFDHGHLAPAADAFLTGNAIAQDHSRNPGQWRKLEAEIRNHRPVRVLTGAIYSTCGNEKIEAPCFLYKFAYLPDGQILTHFAKNAAPRL